MLHSFSRCRKRGSACLSVSDIAVDSMTPPFFTAIAVNCYANILFFGGGVDLKALMGLFYFFSNLYRSFIDAVAIPKHKNK